MYIPRWKGARDIVTEKMHIAEHSVHYGMISILLTEITYVHSFLYIERKILEAYLPHLFNSYQWAVGWGNAPF